MDADRFVFTQDTRTIARLCAASATELSPGHAIAAAFTFGAGVISLQLMKGLAMSRAIKHMNPPAAVPHITGSDT